MKRSGDWALARRLLARTSSGLQQASELALRQEAHLLRKEIVTGLTSQAPGGTTIRPLSPLTLAARKLGGFRGTKALLRRGDLRNSIGVVVERGEVFVGVLRKAKGPGGAGLVNVTLNGKGEMRALKIDPSLAEPGEIEVLEDLIVAAFNDAKGRLEAHLQEEMGKITGGMSLPPGFKLPF